MERRWCTRRVEGVNTPLNRRIAEQGLLRAKTWSWLWRFCATCWPPSNHDCPTTCPVPPCPLHHTPDPTSPTVADDLNNISRTSNNGEAFHVASLKPIPSDTQHAASSLRALSQTWFHMSGPSTLLLPSHREHTEKPVTSEHQAN